MLPSARSASAVCLTDSAIILMRHLSRWSVGCCRLLCHERCCRSSAPLHLRLRQRGSYFPHRRGAQEAGNAVSFKICHSECFGLFHISSFSPDLSSSKNECSVSGTVNLHSPDPFVLNLRSEDNATVKSVIIQHGESEAGREARRSSSERGLDLAVH